MESRADFLSSSTRHLTDILTWNVCSLHLIGCSEFHRPAAETDELHTPVQGAMTSMLRGCFSCRSCRREGKKNKKTTAFNTESGRSWSYQQDLWMSDVKTEQRSDCSRLYSCLMCLKMCDSDRKSCLYHAHWEKYNLDAHCIVGNVGSRFGKASYRKRCSSTFIFFLFKDVPPTWPTKSRRLVLKFKNKNIKMAASKTKRRIILDFL